MKYRPWQALGCFKISICIGINFINDSLFIHSAITTAYDVSYFETKSILNKNDMTISPLVDPFHFVSEGRVFDSKLILFLNFLFNVQYNTTYS